MKTDSLELDAETKRKKCLGLREKISTNITSSGWAELSLS
jgi:hypothetical protein